MRLVRARADQGFGLIELLVSLTILSVVMSGIAYGVISELKVTSDSRGREVGANLAAQAIDSARAVSDLSTLEGAQWTQSVNGITYTVLRTVTDYSSGAASPCDGSQVSAIIYKRVSIRVTWVNMVAKPVVASTLVAPSSASFNPELGNVGVKVVNASSMPVYGALVTVTLGGSQYQTYTDDQGCAFFDSLSPSTYSVTVQDPGYVAPDGTAAPVQTAVVNSGVTTRVAFSMDQAVEIDARLPQSSFPAPSGVALTLGNTAFLPNGTETIPGSGYYRQLTNLYPFPSGYTIWAGSCQDADPEGQMTVNGQPTGPYYPGASRGPAVSVLSGAVNTNVVMAQVTVQVLTSAGLPLVGAPVVATHTTASGQQDQGCPTPEVWTLGTTDGNGYVSASLPWGDWNFSAPQTITPTNQVLAPATTVYTVGVSTP